MITKRSCYAISLFVLGLFSLPGFSAEWKDDSHRNYSGDFNGDSLEDIYLQATPKFILIAGEIDVPIFIDSDNTDIILQKETDGSYTTINNPSEAQTGAITWADGEHNIITGDFNGDGLTDFFLQGTEAGVSSFSLLATPTGTATLNEQYDDDSIISTNATISVTDINSDGRDDLVINYTSNIQKIAYANNLGAFPILANGGLNNSGSFVAATHGGGQVNAAGAASYSIPLKLPDGINGIKPQLGLAYNSRSGNGTAGIGWGLGGLSAITRCAPNLAEDGTVGATPYSNEERFCLDGQKLLAINGGTYGANGTEYRTEIEGFKKVVSYGASGSAPAYFKVWDKTGMIYEYGVTADARVEAQGQAVEVSLWALNKVEDRFGNYYEVLYTEDNTHGEHYLDRINYTGNASASQTPVWSVQMSYIDRPYDQNLVRADQAWGYRAGYLSRSTKLLEKIATYHNSTPIREYNLAYHNSAVTGKNRLDNLTECGYDEQGSISYCANSSQFTWQNGEIGFADTEEQLGVPANHSTAQQPLIIDTNGDGYSDLIYAEGGTWRIALGSANGSFASATNTGVSFGAQDDYAGLAMAIRIGHDNRQGLLAANYNAGADILNWAYLVFGTTNEQVNLDDTLGHKPLVVDFNGDGQEDFIFLKNDPNPTATLYLRNNTAWAPGNTLYTTQDVSSIYTSSSEMDFYGALALDYDGDGLGDILAKKYTSTKGRYLITNNGTGYTRTTTSLPFGDGTDGNGFILDVNSDGLGDFVVRVSNTWRIYINKGGSWDTAINTSISSGGEASNSIVTDYDGDGTLDLLVQHPSNGNWRILLTIQEPQTDGSVKPTFAILDTNYVSKGYIAAVTYNDGLVERRPQDEKPMVADPNGDGLLDLIYHDAGTWYVLKHKIDKPDLMIAATDGFGATTEFDYTPLTDQSVYTPETDGVFPLMDSRASVYAVSEMRDSDGIGGMLRNTYTYKGAKLHMQGRGFLGFRERTVTDEQTHLTTKATFSQSFPYIGAIEESTVTYKNPQTSNETLLERVTKTWSEKVINSGVSRFPYEDTITEEKFEFSDGSLTSVSQSTNTYDDWGNVTNQVINTGSGLSGTAVTGIEQTVTTSALFNNDAANWLLGFQDERSDTHSIADVAVPDKTVTTKFTQVAGTLAVAAQTDYFGTSQQLVSDYSNRNSFGTVTETNISGNNVPSRRIEKSSSFVDGQYPQTITNALNQSVTLGYDLRFGKIKTTTDLNGLVTDNQYDAFSRVVQETSPDGTATDITFNYCSANDNCPANGLYYITTDVSHTNLSGQYGQPRTRAYYDILGRPLRTESTNFDGNLVFSDTEYDNQGRVDRASLPYKQGDTPLWTQYQYDDLGRETLVTKPDGSTTATAYSSSATYVTQAVVTHTVIAPDATTTTQTYKQHSNVLGQLVETRDALDTRTHFKYDAHGNLRWTQVNNDANTVITINFDIVGNKLNLTDPDLGAESYTYDALGQLLTSTDALAQTITTTYDVLGRVQTQVDTSGTNTSTSTWTYDNCTDGVGKLCNLAGPDFDETYSYDSLGRLLSTATNLNNRSTDFVYSYTYDDFSRTLNTIFPSGFSVTNSYNPFGYQESMKKTYDNTVLWQAHEMDAFGNVVSDSTGNGLSTLRIYNAQTGRVENIATGAGTNGNPTDSSIQDLEYQWDSIGNLHNRRSQRNGTEDIKEVFTYDALNRVKTALTTGLSSGSRSLSYDYDLLGNITNKSDVGSYKYGSDCASGGYGPHAVCETTGTVNKTFQYDANGNMAQDAVSGNASRTLSYNAVNKPTQITKGSATSDFKYGPNRSRFYKKVTGNGNTIETYYLGSGSYEEVIDLYIGEIKQKSYVGGIVQHTQTVDIQTNNSTEALQYLHRDHLGSTESITDEQGQLVQRLAFDPYGQRRNSGWEDATAAFLASMSNFSYLNTSQGFTGHEMLDEVNLIHMNGRVYDPVLGRFLSADPYVQAPLFSQSYNRYSYVWNNPLSMVDPSGYQGKVIGYEITQVQVGQKKVGQELIGYQFKGYQLVGWWVTWGRYRGEYYQYWRPVYRPVFEKVYRNIYAPVYETRRTPIYSKVDTKSVGYDNSRVAVSKVLEANRASNSAIKSFAEGAGGDLGLGKEFDDLSTEEILHEGALWIWPGYDLGTCISEGGCSGVEWVVGIVGVIPGGKAAAAGTKAVLKTSAKSAARGAANPKVKAAAARGREAHKEFADKVKAKDGWKSEPQDLIDPLTGRKVIPDAVTPSGRPVELKPNTRSGRAQGRRQLRKYERATGKKGKVVYYDP